MLPTNHNGLLRDLKNLVREDWETTGRDWTKPGFRALAVYRFGIWARQQHRILRRPLLWIYERLYRSIRNRYGIDIYFTARIGRCTKIADYAITVHRQSVVGDYCIIRQNVTLGATVRKRRNDAPILGNRVEIGAGTVIAGRVKIGDDVKIGPNAAVLMNVPPGATVFGNPARILPAAAKRQAEGLELNREAVAPSTNNA